MSLPGKVVIVARHLGSHLEEKVSFTHELPRRRQATMAAFYSVGQLWYESRVSWRLKRCFFISRVVNTALSGIEAFCPSKAQNQALTSSVTCLARRVMAGAAARRGEHGRVRTLTNLSSVFNGFRNAGMGETQVGRGSAKPSASGETGGGRRGQRTRGSATLGGRAGYSVSGQRGRTERPDLHSVQDIPGSKHGKRGRSNGRGRSALPRLRWRNQEQARSRARRRSRATRSPFHVRVGSVPAQLGLDEGVGSRTRGSSEAVLGEQCVEERTSAVGIARSVLQSEAVQESRGQGRVDAHCVLPGPDHLPPRGSPGGSIAAAERSEEMRPRAKRPPRTRSCEALDANAREIERLALRVEQHSQRMAELLRRGVLEPSLAYAFLMR